MLRALWLASTWQPRKRQRRGGWRQRLEEGSGDEEEEVVSRTVLGHLQDWSDGVSSSVGVKRHMSNSVADGMSHHMVVRLSRIGGESGGEQHAHAGMMNILTQVGITDLISAVPDEGR